MNLEEANIELCNVIGWEFGGFMPDTDNKMMAVVNKGGEPNYVPTFCSSLDLLSPIWEKIWQTNGADTSIMFTTDQEANTWHCFIGHGASLNGESFSITEAACISTAKTVKEQRNAKDSAN